MQEKCSLAIYKLNLCELTYRERVCYLCAVREKRERVGKENLRRGLKLHQRTGKRGEITAEQPVANSIIVCFCGQIYKCWKKCDFSICVHLVKVGE